MIRKPDMDPPEENYQVNTKEKRQVRHYKLITPLYGGGVNPNESDPVTTVRGTEVRGHLRFWWRATQLGQFSTFEDLRNAENFLWGSSEVPSKIQVFIHDVSFGEKEYAYEVKSIRNKKPKPVPSSKIAPYAAFPLQPDKDHLSDVNWKSAQVLLDVKFALEIKYPKEHKKEVEDSLWAWETFGGVGARTRRGFGAIKSKGHEEIECNNFKDWLIDGLNAHVCEVEKKILGVPYLSREPENYAFISTNTQPIPCWKKVIGYLQDFRQDKARFEKKYGLSLWPEANAIRNIFGRPPKFPDDDKNHQLVNKFPRAKLGLPINFHMPHDKSIPDELILQGKQGEDDRWIDRMASPLILRPIACNKGSIGLAAVLQWQQEDGDEPYTPPEGLRLKGAPKNPKVKSNLTSEDVSEIQVINQTDILKEFLSFFNSNGGD